MSFALDVNVLLYASDSESPHHGKARVYLERCMQQEEVFCIAWATAMSYIRIAPHPSVFDHPLTHDQATANIATLLSLPQVRFLSEAEGFWDIYRELSARTPTRGNLVPDAHLAAILRQHGVKTLYTTDRDSLKLAFLKVCDPLA
jgi:hypothetical protein